MKPVKKSLAIFLGLLLIAIGSISTIKVILADDNAINIKMYYQTVSSTFTVTTHSGTIQSDGSRDIVYDHLITVKNGQTITTNLIAKHFCRSNLNFSISEF